MPRATTTRSAARGSSERGLGNSSRGGGSSRGVCGRTRKRVARGASANNSEPSPGHGLGLGLPPRHPAPRRSKRGQAPKDGDREEDAVQALADLEQGGPPPAGTPPHREPAAGAHGSAGRRTPRGRLQASGGSYLAMNNASIPRMPGFSLGDERSSAGGASRAQEKGDEGGGVSQQQQQRDESAAPAGGGTSVRPRGAPPGSRSGSRSGTHAKAGGDGSVQISENTGKGGGKGKGKAKRRGVQTASGPPVEPATPPTAKQQQSGKANKRTRASAEDDEDAEEEDSVRWGLVAFTAYVFCVVLYSPRRRSSACSLCYRHMNHRVEIVFVFFVESSLGEACSVFSMLTSYNINV